MKRAALALVVLGLALFDGAPAQAQAPRPRTPIEHFIVLMQENHSFDNYFGTYPGADGFPAGTCLPITVDDPQSDCVRPFHMGQLPALDLPHSNPTFQAQYRDGRMDGFVHATKVPGRDYYPAMGYYDDRDLPYYWNIADNYVLFDRMFQSAIGGSVINHLYWVAGAPAAVEDAGGEDSIPRGGFPANFPTIFDRLSEAGVSWKFYIQNYDRAINYRTMKDAPPNRRAQVVWAPLLAFDRFLDDPALNSRIVDMTEYFSDLENGTLPSVAFMVPSGASEHPPGSIAAGEAMVRNLINNLQRSSYWKSSAFMWTYDDWGGWFDHVPPPRVDEYGYGFRVPALLVSPYAKKGFIDSTQLDFTSMLKFIEVNWNVPPLSTRDAAANNLTQAFDFTAPPREPVFASRERAPAKGDGGKIGRIIMLYSGAILGSAATVGWFWRKNVRLA